MSLVDPFIPAPSHRSPSARPALPHKPKPQLVNNITPYLKRQPVVQHREPQPPKQPARVHTAPKTDLPEPAFKPTPRPTRPFAQPFKQPQQHRIKSKKVRRSLSILHLVVGTAVIMGLGLFMPSLVIGEVCIVAYALVVLIFRIPSNAIFALAATSLIGILVAQQFQDYSPVATVAIYTFMLLTIGALALIRETLRRNKVEA